jgi:1-deoxy-D-xylulose-5-phosphate reductoisomerase
VFNAAKEVALDEFIAGRLRFLQMAALVDRTIDTLLTDSRLTAPVCTLETVQQMDHLARETARRIAADLT